MFDLMTQMVLVLFVSSVDTMHQRPKIHIFLGAPPPPPRPPSPGMEEEEEERPAGWRHLELTWKAGRLRPAAGEGGLIPLRDSGVLPVFCLCDPTRSGSVLEQNGPATKCCWFFGSNPNGS